MSGLRLRLILGFGALTVLVVLLGAEARRREQALWQELERIQRDDLLASRQLAEASDGLCRLRDGEAQFLAAGARERAQLLEEEPSHRDQLVHAIAAFRAGERTIAEQEGLATWNERLAAYLASRPRWFELVSGGELRTAGDWREGRTLPLGRQAAEALRRLEKLHADAGAARHAQAHRVAEDGTRAIVVGTVAVALVAVLLALWLGRAVSRPLRRVAGVAERLSDGRVPAGPTARRGEDLGRLGALLDQVAATLRDLLGHARGATRRLDGSAIGLVAASRQLSDGARAQSARLDDASGETRSMSTALNELASTFDAVAQRTSEYAAAAEDGARAVDGTMQGLEAIRAASLATQDTLGSALHSSGRIGSIVETIQDIGVATHVLSLNASIEASRAGEAGRGFAVVAAEVRALADRASGSAAEVRAIVDALEGQLRAVQQAVAESVVAAEGGVQAGREVAGTFQRIQTSARDTHASVSRMNEVMVDQVQSIQRTAGLVEDASVLSRTQQEAARVVLDQGEALRTVVVDLDQALGRFEVEGEGKR